MVAKNYFFWLPTNNSLPSMIASRKTQTETIEVNNEKTI
jgi:hypothetical protein